MPGYQGRPSQQTGAATIGPPALPFVAFAKYVHQPAGSMPPYAEKALSDARLSDIYAYLKSFPQPSSPKSIPLLNVTSMPVQTVDATLASIPSGQYRVDSAERMFRPSGRDLLREGTGEKVLGRKETGELARNVLASHSRIRLR